MCPMFSLEAVARPFSCLVGMSWETGDILVGLLESKDVKGSFLGEKKLLILVVKWLDFFFIQSSSITQVKTNLTMKVGAIETHHSHTIVPTVVVHDTSKDLGPMHKGEHRYVKHILCQFGFF